MWVHSSRNYPAQVMRRSPSAPLQRPRRGGPPAKAPVLVGLAMLLVACTAFTHFRLHRSMDGLRSMQQGEPCATESKGGGSGGTGGTGADTQSAAAALAAATGSGLSMAQAAAGVAAAKGLHRTAPELGPRSRRWAPLVLSTCTPDMQRHWAPCLVGSAKDPGLAYGEEVIYPAFSIPEPGFVTEEHAQKWREQAHFKAPERFVLRAVDAARKTYRGIFAAQHGQNLVLKNVIFK